MSVEKKNEALQESASKSGASTGPDESALSTQDIDMESLIEPSFSHQVEKVRKLLSQNRQAFLIGAGCSRCAGLPLMEELTNEVLEKLDNKGTTYNLVKLLQQNFGNSSGSSIEDYMSELVDHIAIAKRRESRSGDVHKISMDGNEYSREDLDEALTDIKRVIAEVIGGNDAKISVHRQFVRAIHQKLVSGKADYLLDVSYYILNYDTLFEDALSLECIPLADGFSGGVTGWWNYRAYEDESIHVRIFKLHGSIDWCFIDDDIRPRRVRKGLVEDIPNPVLIWPTSEKYREAQRDPFAEVIGRMRQNLRSDSGTEVVLTICGYSFSDEHINGELDQALHESGGRLTIVAFTNKDEPEGQLKKWREDTDVCRQVLIYANRGFFHGEDEDKSETDLQWWRFEVLARLLGGER